MVANAGLAPLKGAYLHLLDQIACTLSDMPADTRLGVAPHSLRATAPQDLTVLLANSAGRPVHMHIAEQPKEVEDIQNWLAARPVEWLLETQSVTKQWCLIHATHMTEAETLNLAKTGAVVGLCPITEANLLVTARSTARTIWARAVPLVLDLTLTSAFH